MPGRRAAPEDPRPEDRSTGEVLASLVVNTQALVAKEVELVGLELKALVVRKMAAIATLLVGALAAAGVLLLAAATAAIALEEVLEERWMAWGIVTLAAFAISLLLVLVAARVLAGSWSLRSRRSDRASTGTWLRGLGEELTVDRTAGPAGPEGGR
jgi:hypothetical protein